MIVVNTSSQCIRINYYNTSSTYEHQTGEQNTLTQYQFDHISPREYNKREVQQWTRMDREDLIE